MRSSHPSTPENHQGTPNNNNNNNRQFTLDRLEQAMYLARLSKAVRQYCGLSSKPGPASDNGSCTTDGTATPVAGNGSPAYSPPQASSNSRGRGSTSPAVYIKVPVDYDGEPVNHTQIPTATNYKHVTNTGGKSIHLHETYTMDVPLALFTPGRYPSPVSNNILARLLGHESHKVLRTLDGGYVIIQNVSPNGSPSSSNHRTSAHRKSPLSVMSAGNSTIKVMSPSQLDKLAGKASPHRPISINDLSPQDVVNAVWPSLIPASAASGLSSIISTNKTQNNNHHNSSSAPVMPTTSTNDGMRPAQNNNNYVTTVQDYIDEDDLGDNQINYQDIVRQQQQLDWGRPRLEASFPVPSQEQFRSSSQLGMAYGRQDVYAQQQRQQQQQQQQQQQKELPPPPQMPIPPRSKSAFSHSSFAPASSSPEYGNHVAKSPSPLKPKPLRPASSFHSSSHHTASVIHSQAHSPVETLYSADAPQLGETASLHNRPQSAGAMSAYTASSSGRYSAKAPKIYINANIPTQQMAQQSLRPMPQYSEQFEPYGTRPQTAFSANPLSAVEDNCSCPNCTYSDSHVYTPTTMTPAPGEKKKDESAAPPPKPFYKKKSNMLLMVAMLGIGLKTLNALKKKRKMKKEDEEIEKLKKEKEELDKKKKNDEKKGKKDKNNEDKDKKDKKDEGDKKKKNEDKEDTKNKNSNQPNPIAPQTIKVLAQPLPPPQQPIWISQPPAPQMPISVVSVSSYCGTGGQPKPPLPAPATSAVNVAAAPNNGPTAVDCSGGSGCGQHMMKYIYQGAAGHNNAYMGPCPGYPPRALERGLVVSEEHSFGSWANGNGGKNKMKDLTKSAGNDKATFTPPNPLCYPPYTFDPSDKRLPLMRPKDPNPIREYPRIYITKPSDCILIGTVIALQNSETDCLLQTETQYEIAPKFPQAVCGMESADHAFTRWQVLPAHGDKLAAGDKVAYGYQIRLRQIRTKGHLYSHYKTIPDGEGNEVQVVRDPTAPDNCQPGYDESDHWVVECYGSGKYGRPWRASDKIVLRHHISGMVLRCGLLPYSGKPNKPGAKHRLYCYGRGHVPADKSDQWQVVPVQKRQFDGDIGGDF
ncbi:hypothetical protein EV182_000738 [Spiromyces aspiralis]|uniref:Uncharacterized protein n=1 Tax=Spiromyces aspiralis TaxID=68401 RepID=A0ACC1HIY3_9FUNG|nr:hypothetical protein EV182_000738 [Spiromyces aspiralis]